MEVARSHSLQPLVARCIRLLFPGLASIPAARILLARMAAGGRGRKADVDASSLNNVERLILCQAVYEHGSDAWPEVAKVLSTHPMISRPKTFTAQTCSVIYTQLMEEAGFERSDALAVRHARVHQNLAGIHWQRRLQELKELIVAEETRFKTLVAEIDDIRAGRWDNKIRTDLGLPPVETASPKPEPAETHADGATIDVQEPAPAPVATDMEIDEAATVQESLEVASDTNASEHGVPDAQEESDLTSIDQSSPLKAVDKPPEDVSPEPEHPPAIDLTVEEEPEEPTDAPPALPEPEETPDEDVDMSIEARSTHSPAGAASPTAAPEEEESIPTPAEIGDSPEAQTQQDEEQPPPTPAESPETALADMVEDTNLAKQEESAVSTPTPDEPSRADGKRKAMDMDDSLSDSQRDKKRAREESEPVDDDEAAPSAGTRRRIGRPPAIDNPVVSKRFQNMIGMLHSQISQHRYGNIFHNPIRKAEAPDYHDIVKRPMDLKTIKSRIKDGLVATSLEFQRDVYLMLANAMMYNRPGSEIYNMAEEMMQESEVQINTFRQTEGFHRM
ncbi:uncharacterized protein B0H18DRAFT_965813 [Fomitopsis serialis]|uniref:uncharacterized protein n=1 Tax=Fomitopsis serialis TaxID=139415 RepID=UPI002008317B|nr:uncharacterized protein B0H18DRAFT_965813 [Neoantrodia serialis]KAH9938151.1 hypothetical protein B0H18DRAFT_965813 [Neoantrodia serialis]